VGQAATAFGPAPNQNITAGFAGHALKKTMFTATLAFLRLVSPLWHAHTLTQKFMNMPKHLPLTFYRFPYFIRDPFTFTHGYL